MKLKLVWLCHFSNAEVEAILKPWRHVSEFAPWMPMAIETMEGNPKYELYIIAPYPYICGIKRFSLRGVNYVFYNANMPLLGINWPRWFPWDYLSNFKKLRWRVGRIIDEIHPDIIHLFGAENHDYSPAVIPLIGRYPIALTVQGFLSHTTYKFRYIERVVSAFENQIIKSIPIIFYERKKQKQDILAINPNAKLYWHTYGSYEVSREQFGHVQQEYDIVFFGRINRDKGIVDLFQAIKAIKEEYGRELSVCVLGKAHSNEFLTLSKELGIAGQIIWKGFLPTRMNVFGEALKARISILPTYHDVMPGTIMESMFLGIPVISYATDSIPEINEDYEAICLVERGNIGLLSKKIIELIDDPEKLMYFSRAGQRRAYEMFAPKKEDLVNCLDVAYTDAIQKFKASYHG